MDKTIARTAQQIDFFAILERTVPNEDIQVFQTGRFSCEIRFDPKQQNQFMMFNYIAQMSATVRIDTSGTIIDITPERFGNEAGEIEPVFYTQFKTEAEQFIKDSLHSIAVQLH